MGRANKFLPKHPLFIYDKSLRQARQPVLRTNIIILVIKDRHCNTELRSKFIGNHRFVSIEYCQHLKFIFRQP